ncbi:glycerophosphodiester phosphodiesterase [Erysipelothrix sp. HDW6C]|uniref:glycerophosphodiester phosphodiesterase n=1 Tax=Erysipelothrix sp. HDW6C TaxID=2714930 RepID=UPI00140C221C|nr:glycerophosphodiester phosphodiesterase [Erysipelothrix sp. HDW6C]QIK70760.1 glycerophosphodiester phosphodiesterase [Erysipelothrix sp. HDW6C]
MKLKARDILKESTRLIGNDLWRYVLVIALTETMALLLVRQVSSRIFQLALVSAKVQGINNQNYLQILTNPIALILILFTLFLLGTFVVLQITTVLAFADRPYHDNKLSLKSIFKPILKMKPTNYLVFVLYIFIIMPLGNVGLTSVVTESLRIPSFIIEFIESVPWMMITYYLGLIVLFYLNIRFFFAFIIFYNEPGSFMQALKHSWTITRKHAYLIFKITILIGAGTILATLLALLITLLPLIVSEHFFPNNLKLVNSLLSTAFLFLVMFIVSLSSIFMIQGTVVAYHQLKGDQVSPSRAFYKPKKHSLIINSLVIIAFVFFAAVAYFDTPNHALAGSVSVVSHRGESRNAVENTLESLELAAKHKPSYVEMDIQQLADGTIVVFHDYDLKRLAGINRKLNTYTIDELRGVSIHSHGNTSTIPTLDEYLALADSLNQNIMIEIKTTTKDSPEFLGDIMKIVESHNMRDRVIYQSLDKYAILNYKEKFPDATVGYILGINIGGLEDMNVDFFSLEDYSVTTRVVNDAQRMRKGLFVWTINSEELMQFYFKTQITGIITDNLELAEEVREDMKKTPISDLFWSLDFLESR